MDVSGVVDNRRWLRTRLETLEQARQGQLSADDRQAVDAEIERLRDELRRHRRWWMLWGGVPR
jgi:hypothetical protein